MSTNVSVIQAGATFAQSVPISQAFEDGYFSTWSILAHVFSPPKEGEQNFSAKLETTWANPGATRELLIHSSDTSYWPIGLLKYRVVLESPSGDYVEIGPFSLMVTAPPAPTA